MVRKHSRIVALLGLPISNVTMQQAVASIDGRIRNGASHQIATANLDFVSNARNNSELHRVICDCAMVLPDGMPLLWASRLLHRPLKERVTGVDLTPLLAKLSAEKGYGIFILGSTDENAQAAMRVMEEQYPGVRFVGQYAPPPAALQDMDDEDILRRVHEARPEILLVAFGNPKQEFWIHRNRQRLGVPVSIGIGGTLEMIAGAKKRAPRWIQSLQMEWLFRMLQEPTRLLPRYAKDFFALLKYLPREMFAAWMQPAESGAGDIKVDRLKGHRVLTLPPSLTGAVCNRLRDEVTEAMANQSDVTLDLSQTVQVQADGVGCLLDLRRAMTMRDRQMYLIGASDAIGRVLSVSALSSLFQRGGSSPTLRARVDRASTHQMAVAS